MFATNYFENLILNTSRGSALTAPPTMYVALFLDNPGESGAGVEITYGAYKRLPVAFSEPAAGNGGITIQNTEQITFGQAEKDAGTVTHIGLMDSLTGGNMYCYAELADQLEVKAQVVPMFTAGTINFTITGGLSDVYKAKYLNVLRGKSVEGFGLFAALFNGDPENGGSELSGANYSRVALEMSAPAEADSGQMRIQNSARVSFPNPTTAWGTWTHTAFYNAQSGGEPVWKQANKQSWELKAGRTPIFDQGALKLAVN